jgi:hypothetical protein
MNCRLSDDDGLCSTVLEARDSPAFDNHFAGTLSFTTAVTLGSARAVQLSCQNNEITPQPVHAHRARLTAIKVASVTRR